VIAALHSPEVSGLVIRWSVQPLAVVAVLGLAAWYAAAVRTLARRGTRWPVRRTVLFALGLVAFAWTTNGFPQAYASSLYWVWTSQTLSLLLLVPLILLVGQPLQLARAVGSRGVSRFLRSGVARLLANPLVGPAVVPLLSAALFFGPAPAWAIRTAAVGWILQLALIVVGGLILMPLVGVDEEPSSLAVGLSLAIGSFELVLDAIPGIALRLHTTLVTSYFDHRVQHSWAPSALHDQQVAGAILWCVSEVIDLPFLLLVYRRWLRADARDAAQVDAVLDAERLARGGVAGSADGDAAEAPADAPWWLTDPTMQSRLRRRG
jgi:putative membrane protein